jgi:hypothetical protein
MTSALAVDRDRQAELEARAGKLSAANLAGCKNLRDVFGGAKEWELDVGPYRFLLIPFLREWWFYDSLHKEWRFTGRRIGEVRFAFDGKRLALEEVGSASAKDNARATTPPAAPATRFCVYCGAPVDPEWKFCQACGKQVPHGA